MGPAKLDECVKNKHIIISVGEFLGFLCYKSDGPTPCLTFLGIEVDSEAMELRLTLDKPATLHSLIKEWLGHKAYTKIPDRISHCPPQPRM